MILIQKGKKCTSYTKESFSIHAGQASSEMCETLCAACSSQIFFLTRAKIVILIVRSIKCFYKILKQSTPSQNLKKHAKILFFTHMKDKITAIVEL